MPEVADRAQQVQEAAQEQVQEKKEQARNQLRDQVETRSTEIGQQVSGTGEAIREAASQLRQKGQDGPARVTEQAAEKMEQAGRWLEQSDADRILSDVEDFARRQPWAVLAGGLVLGFAASRFLKSSSQQRYSKGSDPSSASYSKGSDPSSASYSKGSDPSSASDSSGLTPSARPQPPALADGNGVV